MPSADQVPVNSSHPTMRWHKWVVLIAGSTGSALSRRHQPHGMAERLEMAGPMMRRGASLDANQAEWQLFKERQDLATL